MKRLLLVLGLLLLAAFGGALILREPAAPGGPVDLVPGDARSYLQLASLPGPAARVTAFVRHLGFGGILGAGRNGVRRQLGFDPFDSDALRLSGVDPDRPLGGFQPAEGEDLVVFLPLQDVGIFATTFTRLWVDRTGGVVEEGTLEGHGIRRALDPAGLLGAAWAPYEGHAVIATGPRAQARLLSVLAAGGAPGLARNPPFAEAFAALAPGSDLFVWALSKGASRSDRRLAVVEAALPAGALALTLAPSGARLGIYGDLDAVAATALPVFLPPNPKITKKLLAELSPDAVLVGRLALSPAGAWRRLRQLPWASAVEGIEAQARARGVEIETLLQILGGHFVFGLWPAAEVELSHLPAFDLRRTNPFTYLNTEVRVALTDAEKARGLLPNVAEVLAPALRAEILESEIEGVEVFTLRYHLGEGMSFGIVGDDLLVTGGEGVFAAAIARVRGSAPDHDLVRAQASLLGGLQGQGSAAVVLQMGRLITALGEVDAERLGGGPGGMALALAFGKLKKTFLKIDHLALEVSPRASAMEASVNLSLVSPVRQTPSRPVSPPPP